MEIYRTFHGPFPGCASYEPLLAIYRTGLPALPVTGDLEDVSVYELRERDSKMFFPRTDIQKILDEDVVRNVLNCTCFRCKDRREKNSSEFDVLVRYVSNHARILLAILIYIGHSSWINVFKKGRYGDDNLDGFLFHVSNHAPLGLSPGFKGSFQAALDLFRPPIFTMGAPKFNYEQNQRFPYINDELCGEGTSGTVRRFEIHDDYLDKSLRKVASKYTLSENGLCVFARKILKYSMSDKDFEMEQQVLRIIDEQQHPNIIDLIAFYSWRGELNCVFPFVKLTLAEVLHSDWKPTSLPQPGTFPKHWLWLQMVEVADALRTIHHPTKLSSSERGSLAGFHFDLKPKNILVTPEGVLKITDFGQSTIERVREYDYDSEDNIRGDPIYGPPEACPSRTEIQQLRVSIAPEEPPRSTPPLPSSFQARHSIASRTTSWATTHMRQRSDDFNIQSPSISRSPTNQTLVSRGHTTTSLETRSTPSFESRADSSSVSIAPSSEPYEHNRLTVIANYDVWSLACIFTEVLVFILKGGTSAVKAFEAMRKLEKRDLCFHNGNHGDQSLKSCVRSTLEELRYNDQSEAITGLGYPRSYLYETIDLVFEMFNGDPRLRLSSEQIIQKLAILKDKHAEDDEPQPDIVKYMKSLGPPDAFRELGYAKNGIVISFYTMIGIKYEIDINSLVDCRLQVFRKDGAFYIRICYGEPFIDKSHLFATKDSFYCPLYLFDTQQRLICCLKDGHVRRTLHFTTGEDLMTFQTVIMRHQAIRGIRISEVFLEPKSKPNEKYENLFDINNPWPRCQIWIARDPQYVTTHSSQSIGNRPTPKEARTVFFFSLKGLFGVPLQDGPKLIKEERGPKESIRQKPTKVSIAGPDKWVRHFYFIKPDNGTIHAPYGQPVSPAIPLSSKWLRQDESKKATKLDLKFPQYEDLVKLKAQISEANRNGRHSTNNIKWEEARTVPTGHGQRS